MINPYKPTSLTASDAGAAQLRNYRFADSLYVCPLIALIVAGVFAPADGYPFVLSILVVAGSFIVPLLVLPSLSFLKLAYTAGFIALIVLVPVELLDDSLGWHWVTRFTATGCVIVAATIVGELTYHQRILLGAASALVTTLVIMVPLLTLCWCLIGVFMNHTAIQRVADNQEIHRSSGGPSTPHKMSTPGTR